MRAVVFLGLITIAYEVGGKTPSPEATATLVVVLLIAAVMDIAEWVANVFVRRD